MKLIQKMYGEGLSKYYLYKKICGIWVRVYSSFDREDCIKQHAIMGRKVLVSSVELL